MISSLPAVLSSGDLSPAELSALRLDGEAVPLGRGCMLPADLPECPETRLAAVLRLLRPVERSRLIVSGVSAAWVWQAAAERPRVDEFAAPAHERYRPVSSPAFVVRELRLADRDVVHLGTGRVLSPARLLVELAGRPSTSDTLLAALAAASGRGVSSLLAEQERLSTRRAVVAARRTGRSEAIERDAG